MTREPAKPSWFEHSHCRGRGDRRLWVENPWGLLRARRCKPPPLPRAGSRGSEQSRAAPYSLHPTHRRKTRKPCQSIIRATGTHPIGSAILLLEEPGLEDELPRSFLSLLGVFFIDIPFGEGLDDQTLT
jgi:hypothetical protein